MGTAGAANRTGFPTTVPGKISSAEYLWSADNGNFFKTFWLSSSLILWKHAAHIIKYSMDHCRNGLTILNFGELASPPYPSGGGSGGGGSGSAGSGTTGSAGGGSDTESDQESVGSRSSVNFVPSFF